MSIFYSPDEKLAVVCQTCRQKQELYNLEIARLLAGSAEYNGQTGGAFRQRRQKLVSENRPRLDPAETMPPVKK